MEWSQEGSVMQKQGASLLKNASNELRSIMQANAAYSQVDDFLAGTSLDAHIDSTNRGAVAILRERIDELSRQIARQKAVTFSELAAKLEVLAQLVSGDPEDAVSALAKSAAEDLHTMLGVER